MKRCNPVEMRKNLLIVNEMRLAGMDFVAIPVKSADHKEALIRVQDMILDEMTSAATDLNPELALAIKLQGGKHVETTLYGNGEAEPIDVAKDILRAAARQNTTVSTQVRSYILRVGPVPVLTGDECRQLAKETVYHYEDIRGSFYPTYSACAKCGGAKELPDDEADLCDTCGVKP